MAGKPQHHYADKIAERIQRFGPIAVDDICVASRPYTTTLLRDWRAQGIVHISGWGSHDGKNHHMLIAWGPGKDVPRPRQTHEAILAQRRANKARLDAKKRAGLHTPHQGGRPRNLDNLPPPTLPTFTPRFGIWGI